MLGFSVYLGHDLTSENYNYLLTMRNSGFTCVFTQLAVPDLSLIHISEPTRLHKVSRMPSSA